VNAADKAAPGTLDAAIAHAVNRAARHGIEMNGSYCVYRDKTTVYVLDSLAAKPAGSELVCVAQRWDSKTVQVRYPGARSEWVTA
jgi:hypothetical protein